MNEAKDMNVFEEDEYDHLPSFSDLAKECHFICVQLIGRGAQRNEPISTMWRTGIFNHGYVKKHTRDRTDGIRRMLDSAIKVLEDKVSDPDKKLCAPGDSYGLNPHREKELFICLSVKKDPKSYTLVYLKKVFRSLVLVDKFTDDEATPRLMYFMIARKLKELKSVFDIIHADLPLNPEKVAEYE